MWHRGTTTRVIWMTAGIARTASHSSVRGSEEVTEHGSPRKAHGRRSDLRGAMFSMSPFRPSIPTSSWLASLRVAASAVPSIAPVTGVVTWSEVSALFGLSIFDIEFTPDGTAFIGTIDSVWVSNDGSVSWTERNLGIGLNDQVLGVTIDPSNPSILWVGVGDASGPQPINIMRSTDGGFTWTDPTPPLGQPMSGRAIAVDPNDSNTVIAVFGGDFGGGQVWVTTDGGDSWTDRSAGLPGNPLNAAVYNGTRLLVGGGLLFGSAVRRIVPIEQPWVPPGRRCITGRGRS